MSTPSPTPFATTPFEPTFAVDEFHEMVRLYGGNTFAFDDRDYWYGISVSACLPVILVFLFIPIYWIFLCCRTGCCANCCCYFQYEWTKSCFKHYCCFCPITCCAKMDEEDVKRNIRHDICQGKGLEARAVLFIMFAFLAGINIYITTAGDALISGMKNTADLLSDVGEEFSDLQSYAQDLNSSSTIIIANARGMDCSSGTSSDVAEQSVETLGKVIQAAALAILDILDGLPEKLDSWADFVEERGIKYVNMGVIAMAALGLVYAAIGLVGTLCFERHNDRCCSLNFFLRASTNFLALANIVACPLLVIFAVMLMVELYIGFPLADFCAAGPANTLVTGLQDAAGDSSFVTTTFSYYTQCSGTNPFKSDYDTMAASVDNITNIMDEYKKLFVSVKLCCDGSSSVDESSAAESLYASCDLYYNTAKASTADCSVSGQTCDFSTGSTGFCIDGGGCSNTSFVAINNEIDTVFADSTGPLGLFYSAFGCANINPLFAKLLNTILCSDLTEALYYLVFSHGCTLSMMAICMILSSFMRQTIWKGPQKEEKYKADGNKPGDEGPPVAPVQAPVEAAVVIGVGPAETTHVVPGVAVSHEPAPEMEMTDHKGRSWI